MNWASSLKACAFSATALPFTDGYSSSKITGRQSWSGPARLIGLCFTDRKRGPREGKWQVSPEWHATSAPQEPAGRRITELLSHLRQTAATGKPQSPLPPDALSLGPQGLPLPTAKPCRGFRAHGHYLCFSVRYCEYGRLTPLMQSEVFWSLSLPLRTLPLLPPIPAEIPPF